MKIGNVVFKEYPLFLAPMEDVTDPAFRLICKRFGADMVYTEFVSSEALIRNVNRTVQKLTLHDEERPVAIQIYGHDPESMARAAIIAEESNPDIIDINFGCPVKKVACKGAGAGLLRDIPTLLEITDKVVKAVSLPVTIKTRLGWDDENKVIVDLAERLQDIGIQAITVHGRTRSQMYTGSANWELIGEVKKNPRMRIPVIGNGDVVSPKVAMDNFKNYGVDAVMIGRGSIGRPWIFREIKDYINGNQHDTLTYSDKLNVLKEHIIASVRWLDSDEDISLLTNRRLKGIIHARRHLAATPLFKGIPNFKETRIAMLRAETLAELFSILDNINPNYQEI